MAGGPASPVQGMASMSLAEKIKADACLCSSDLSLSDDKEKIRIEFDFKDFQQRFVRSIEDPKPERYVELVKMQKIPPLCDLSKKLRSRKQILIYIPDCLKAILNDAIQGNVSVYLQGNLKHRVSVYIDSVEIFDYTDITNTEALMGLVITVQSYPENWWDLFFWDAWLAVTIQLHLLVEQEQYMGVDEDLVFPTLWFKNIFDAERLCGEPKDVKCLLLGQDPVSKATEKRLNTKLRRATGIAFHAIGNDNPSIKGMNKCYGLDCDDDNPETHCGNGLLLVNMIRCIPQGSPSVDNNPYHDAWVAYTVKLANHCAGLQNLATPDELKVIILCEGISLMLTKYLPAACDKNYTNVPHPAHVKEYVKGKGKYTKKIEVDTAAVKDFLSKL